MNIKMSGNIDSPLRESCSNLSDTITSVLHNSVFSRIPVFGWAIDLCIARDDIRSRVFIEKLYKFLSPLQKMDEATKQRFRDKAAASPELQKKLGESIFFALERFNDFDKPVLLSYLVFACADDIITIDELRRLNMAIENAFSDDLISLLEQEQPLKTGEPSPWMCYLNSSGLTQVVTQYIDDIGTEPRYEISPLGKQLRAAYLHGKKATENYKDK